MEHSRVKPGKKLVVDDEKKMSNNAKNALKQRKWRTMRSMVRHAEKLMKEVMNMEFLVILSFDGGMKFAGTGTLLDNFKKGQALTDGTPHGISYTKDSKHNVVDLMEPPPCFEVKTPESSTAGDALTELSDLHRNVRREEQRDQVLTRKRAREANGIASQVEEQPCPNKTTRKKGNNHLPRETQEEPQETGSIQPGSFVYVAVPTSSNRTVPFVARVTQSEPLYVKYLHLNKTRRCWHFPDTEDTGAISSDDIIKVLAEPEIRISGSRFYMEFRDLP